MSVTAKLLKAVKSGGVWKLAVEFSDGEETGVKHYRFNGTTTQQLINFIRSESKKLVKVKESDYSDHIGKEVDITDEVIPEPTAEEIAKTAWLNDYRKLNQMLSLIDSIPALATTQANKAIADLRTSLEANWLNSYLGDL